MTIEIALLIAIVGFTVAAFAFEWMPIDVVAFTCLGLLLACGLIDAKEAVSGFSNEAVVTVMMMFILSDSLVQSGVVRKLGYKVIELAGQARWKATSGLLSITGVLSAFINNVAAVSIFMPVTIHLAKHYKISPSKLLLPLSYASIFGGACTLIGTSTNLLVSSLSAEQGEGAFSVFEFASFGSVLFIVGMAYNFLVPMRWLPSRSIISSLTRKYHLGGYLTELRVPEASRLVGSNVAAEQISQRFQMNVLEIIRGSKKIAADLRNTLLEVDDLLLVRGPMDEILSFKEQYGLRLLTDVKLRDSDLSDENNILAEIQLSPTSRLVSQTVQEINFRNKFGAFVLALNRTGEMIREKVAFIPLRQWDTLLVFGPRSRIEALYEGGDFMPLQELDIKLHLAKRWWLSALIVPIVVVLAALGVMSILKAAILGVVALLLTRCMTIQQAYKSINWTVIFLVACILPLGIAMQRTGLDSLIAEQILKVGAAYGPLAVIAVIYLVTSLLTEVISNNSTVVLMVPVSITLAELLGVDTRPLLMTVAFAGSSSLLTPMGYKTNAMVYGPGGYRFSDYLRVGTPLKILFFILSIWLIPVFWPL